MRTVFIINPLAGNGNAMKKWLRFKKGISFPFEEYVTQYPGEATEIASSFGNLQEEVLLIGFGGDGTLREIIAGAAGNPSLIVGSVPAGSGNDFARGYHSFRSSLDIGEFLKEPISKPEDLGEFKEGANYKFANSSGIGLDAEIAFRVNQSSAKMWLNKMRAGKLIYLLYVMKTVLTFQKFDLKVETEGKQLYFHDVWLATVSNQPFFGGGMAISPDSRTDDGKLELTIVHGISRKKLLYVFRTVFTGAHLGFREVAHMSGTDFGLTTNKVVYRHIDGDYAGKTTAGLNVSYAISRHQWKSIILKKKEDAKK